MRYNGVRLDEQAQEVLRRIYDAPSRMVSTRDLTSTTELDKDATRYRFKRLAEANVVTIAKSEEQREGTVATLTEQGRETIDAGLLGDIFDAHADEGDIVALRRRVRALEDDVENKQWKIELLGSIVGALCETVGGDVTDHLDDRTVHVIREMDAKNS